MGKFDAFFADVAEEEQAKKQKLAEDGQAVDLNPPPEFAPLQEIPGSEALEEIVVTAGPPSKFEKFFEGVAADENRRTEQALILAGQADPDTYVKARKAASKYEIPVDVAMGKLSEIDRTEAMTAARGELEKNPVIAQWFKDGDNAAHVSLSELERLSGVEWLMKAGGSAMQQGVDQTKLAMLRYKQMNGQASPEEVAQADGLSKVEAARLGNDGWLQSGFVNVAQMLPYMMVAAGEGFKGATVFGSAGAVAGAISGSAFGGIGAAPGAVAGYGLAAPAGMAYGAFAATQQIEAGLAYDEFSKIRDVNGQPIDPDVIRYAATAVGAANGALEVVGLGRLAKMIPGVNNLGEAITRRGMRAALEDPATLAVLTNFAKEYVKTGATEVAVESLQELSTILGGEAAKAASGQQVDPVSFNDAAARIRDTAIATAQAMTIMGMVGSGRLVQDLHAASKAKANAPILEKLGEAMRDNGARMRAPDRVKALVDQAADGGDLSEVFIPAERAQEFFQQMTPEDRAMIEAAVPDIGTRMTEATAMGGDIRLTTGEWASGFAGAQMGDLLAPYVRFDAEGMSMHQAAEFEADLNGLREESFQKDMQRAEAERLAREPVETIYDDVRERSMQAGITGDRADKIATLLSSFFATRAARDNMDALSLYQSYGLSINRALPESLQFIPTDSQDLVIDAIRSGRLEGLRLAEKQKSGSLVDFIVKRGGLDDSQGELAAMDAAKMRRGLVRKADSAIGGGTASIFGSGTALGSNEYRLDATARAAWENGFFPELGTERPSTEQLLAAIRDELAGNPRFAERGDQASAAEQWVKAAEDLRDYMDRAGIDYSGLTNSEVKAELAKSSMAGAGQEYFQGVVSTDSAAFRAWFGNSKVVDENGAPLVVYHGTNQDFEAFDAGRAGENYSTDTAGIFLTTDREEAEGYGGRVIEAYARIENPLLIKAGKDDAAEVWYRNRIAYTNRMTDGGHDGVIVTSDSGEKMLVVRLPEQIKSVNNRGTFDPADPRILYQADGGAIGDGKRGSIQFGDRSTTINLFQNENLSTFLHESGHLFLQVFHDIATTASATEQTKADWADIKDWLGLKGDEITTEAHEKFARGFEAYLFEGQTPSEGLRSAFAAFRSWLVVVYRHVTNIGEPVPDKIRAVMDRMLATDEQIANVMKTAAFTPALPDSVTVDMTAEERLAYRKAADDLVAQAKNEVDRKLMAEVKRATTQEWRDAKAAIREEVVRMFEAMPVYQAMRFLQKGELVGSAIERFPGEPPAPLKLDRAELERMYGPTIFGRLPRSVPPIYSKAGVSPDLVAEMFGFPTGTELVNALMSSPPMGRAITAEVDTRMRDKFGDLLSNTAALAGEALAAAHSDGRSMFIETELKALSNRGKSVKSGGRTWLVGGMTPRELAIRIARDVFNRKKVRDAVRVGHYTAAEQKNARDAERAILAEKWDEAAEWKRRQLLAHEMAMQSKSVAEEVEKIQRALDRYAGTKAPAGVDASYVEQIKQLLDRFDTRRVSNRRLDQRAKLRDFLAELEANNQPVPDIPDGLLNDAYRTNYRDMTVEGLRGLADAVAALEHLGKMKSKLIAEKRARELSEVVANIEQSIRENSKGKKPIDIETRAPKSELARMVSGFFAAHRKMSSLVRQLDGHRDNGPMWEAIMRPFNKAGDREATMTAKASEALSKLFKKYGLADVGTFHKKEFIPEINMALSKSGMLSVALNWGNLDNRAKLKDAYRWNDGQVAAILERLDERDWMVVQGVLDHINSYWPEIEAKQKRVYGVAPAKVDAAPIVTRFGTFAGGYYPLKYDDRQSPRAFAQAAKEEAKRMMSGASARATTKRGHTKERVASAGLPVRLDLGVAFEHVGQVIHDLTHHETLIDVNRVLGDGRVQAAIFEYGGGDQVYGLFRSAIEDIAAGQVPATNAVEKGLNWLRSGASIAGMGWSLTTALQQPLGLSQSIVRVGPKWIALGMARMFRDASSMESTNAWVSEKSEFMRMRSRTQMREIADVRNTIRTKGRILGPVEDSFFWMITRMQLVADLPTWVGQYEKSMASGVPEARAIELADQAVIDSQSGGQVKDLAKIQRGGPMMKLWTNFYSYFSTLYNLTAETIDKTDFRSPASIGIMAANFLMLYTVPVVGWMLIKGALEATLGGGDDDDKKDENLAARLAREHLSYVTGTMVGVRELSSTIQGFYGYSGPAGARFFSDAGKLGRQVSQGEVDAELLKALNNTAGTLFHYPAGQIGRTIDGIAAIAEGKTKSPAALIIGGPKQ